jgi:hypothetical protein
VIHRFAPLVAWTWVWSCSTTPVDHAAECRDLRALSRVVRATGLPDAQVQCLERRVADPADPDRAAASDLLVWDARRLNDDYATWRSRAERHLSIRPEDVQVRVQLARHQQRQGPSGAEASWKLADEGLLRGGGLSAQDRHDLWKLKAIAAEMMSPPEAGPETRARTVEASTAWYLAAKEAGEPTEWPYAMCTNAGGSPLACTGEP